MPQAYVGNVHGVSNSWTSTASELILTCLLGLPEPFTQQTSFPRRYAMYRACEAANTQSFDQQVMFQNVRAKPQLDGQKLCLQGSC